jgi:hypothetical protein
LRQGAGDLVTRVEQRVEARETYAIVVRLSGVERTDAVFGRCEMHECLYPLPNPRGTEGCLRQPARGNMK